MERAIGALCASGASVLLVRLAAEGDSSTFHASEPGLRLLELEAVELAYDTVPPRRKRLALGRRLLERALGAPLTWKEREARNEARCERVVARLEGS